MAQHTGALGSAEGLADDFNRLCGSEETCLQVCDRAVRAVKEIAVRMGAEVSAHFRIGDGRREAVERVGEESTARAIEQVAKVRGKCEQYKELARWANTLRASLDCVDRGHFVDKPTELVKCYDAVGQMAEREDWRMSEVTEHIQGTLSRYSRLQTEHKSSQEQLKALQEQCARQQEEIRGLKPRVNEQSSEVPMDTEATRDNVP
ncbi:hypothetical protein Y032_1121g3635, partial [Ancylostoma ceylanicum]